MRALGSRWALVGALLGLGFGCGESDGGSGSPAAGSGTVAGSSSAAGGPGDSAGGAGDLVDCDPTKILCKRLSPSCDAGQVPRVAGSCYGDCVKIERCACSTAAQCPEPEQYTCWAKQHCGPYVQ